jgi:hypothetical protein
VHTAVLLLLKKAQKGFAYIVSRAEFHSIISVTNAGCAPKSLRGSKKRRLKLAPLPFAARMNLPPSLPRSNMGE